MKKSVSISCLQLCISIFFLNSIYAQSVVEPIQAKQRLLIYQVQPDGVKTLKQERSGLYSRSSSGATMNTMGDQSTFSDEHGNTYNIIHSKKVAELIASSAELLHERIKKTPPESIHGYEVVNGLRCAIRNVLFNNIPAGKEYTSVFYGLIVKTEVTIPQTFRLVVREIYDIEFIEPDPLVFRIPEGYTLNKQPTMDK